MALSILYGVDEGRIQLIKLIQPPHFIAEVATVLAREKLDEAEDDLLNIESRVANEPEIYMTSIDLAKRYRHHLSDTLYHAVALNTPSAIFITADSVYYQKAKGSGRIMLLKDYIA